MNWLTTDIIAELAPTLGFTVHIEPEYRYVGRLVAPDGRVFYFRNTNFDLNGQGASAIARDKFYAAYFLARLGYPVPEGRVFYSDEWCHIIGEDRDIHGLPAALAYARSLGWPVIVKPNSKSQGSGVAKVYTEDEFRQALREVYTIALDTVALVQPFITADDYRVVVLDDEVIAVYQRIPLSVVGDGATSIHDLLARRQREYVAQGRDTRIHLDDPRLAVNLRRTGRTLQSIPAEGERVLLLDNANLSTGGDAIDWTERLHPGYRELAITIMRDMGLRYGGLDLLLTQRIDQPPDPAHYTILEINSSAAVDYYAKMGDHQRCVVEGMYEKILRALLER